MDRRTMLKGAGAAALVLLVPALPARKFGATSLMLDGDNDRNPAFWRHFAVTRDDDGNAKAFIDGVQQIRPWGQDYKTFETLTDRLFRDQSLAAVEQWIPRGVFKHGNQIVTPQKMAQGMLDLLPTV